MTYIAKLLRERRQTAGMSRAEAARVCGVRWNHYWEWETGRHPPKDLDTVLAALGAKKKKRRG